MERYVALLLQKAVERLLQDDGPESWRLTDIRKGLWVFIERAAIRPIPGTEYCKLWSGSFPVRYGNMFDTGRIEYDNMPFSVSIAAESIPIENDRPHIRKYVVCVEPDQAVQSKAYETGIGDEFLMALIYFAHMMHMYLKVSIPKGLPVPAFMAHFERAYISNPNLDFVSYDFDQIRDYLSLRQFLPHTFGDLPASLGNTTFWRTPEQTLPWVQN